MIEEELVELDGPVGRCSSTAAVEVARRLAGRRDRNARLHRVIASEGISPDGSATRWEARFDLPTQLVQLVVVVTFTFDEDRQAFGSGVAALLETAFPAPGSELERMAVAKGLSRRRLRGIWRQTMADHRPLGTSLPDASDVIDAVVRSGRSVADVRSLEASVSRSDVPRWIITHRGGRDEVRWTEVAGAGFRFSIRQH